jgi:CIC family chloride channel protein
MKLAATVFSYSSGGAGGIFAPALFIGGMLGGAIGHLDGRLLHHADSQVGAFALVGMGAVFAGIIRAPITSVLIIFEMTGNYGLILPLMIANMTSYGLARRLRPIPIYEALLEQDNIHLPHQRSSAKHALEQIRVAETMTRDIITLPADISIANALKRTEANNFSTYPVIGDGGSFIGSVTISRMRRKLAEGEGELPVSKVADKSPAVFPDQPLVRVVLKMDQSGWRQFAVVDRRNHEQLLGIITMSDVVRMQARAAREAGQTDRTIIPEFSEVGDELETQTKG